MKKIMVIFMLFLLVGCYKKDELSCYKKDVNFEYGKMDRFVSFSIDKEDYVTSSTVQENRKYDNKENAFSFLDANSEYVEKKSDTELTYIETTNYEKKVLSASIKHAMEAQEYTCNYK